MFLQWIDAKHSLGLPQIDTEHKQLFLIANQLHEAGQQPPERRNVIPALKQLYAYSHYHFNSEEGMFKHFGYNKATEHHGAHQVFTEKIKNYLDDFREKPHASLDEPLDFLVMWIVNHIMGEDKQYIEYFAEQGIEPSLHFSVSGGSSQGLSQDAMKLWETKKMALEIHDIDEQHKTLVYILQQINDLQRANKARQLAFLPTIIRKLFYYSQFHFSFEEELMSKHGYGQTLDHRKLHEDFSLRIHDFAREYRLGKESLVDEMVLFLKDWVVHHILEEDSKYKHALQAGMPSHG